MPMLDQRKKLTLLKHKRKLLEQARKHASTGAYTDFEHVRRAKFKDDDAFTLKLWATARERDEIDVICNRAPKV